MIEITVGGSKIQVVRGDITAQDTEAVVNAANRQLAPGGGVAGAIHRKAGPALWEECRKLGGCATGEAKITRGYNLPNPYVIHTVGPVYSGSKDDPLLLKSCYVNSLKLAETHGITSISFPAISTGIFGYPLDEAATIAVETIAEYLTAMESTTGLKTVRMVLYDEEAYEAHVKALEKILKERP